MHGKSKNLDWYAIRSVCRTSFEPSLKYTTDIDSTSRLKSVTQERDLDEFLNTAQLAETDFTAGNYNICRS